MLKDTRGARGNGMPCCPHTQSHWATHPELTPPCRPLAGLGTPLFRVGAAAHHPAHHQTPLRPLTLAAGGGRRLPRCPHRGGEGDGRPGAQAAGGRHAVPRSGGSPWGRYCPDVGSGGDRANRPQMQMQMQYPQLCSRHFAVPRAGPHRTLQSWQLPALQLSQQWGGPSVLRGAPKRPLW